MTEGGGVDRLHEAWAAAMASSNVDALLGLLDLKYVLRAPG